MPNAKPRRAIRPAQQQNRPGHQRLLDPPPQGDAAGYRASGRLAGRIALITGGDSGIGRAVAVAFTKEGADIVVSHLHEDRRFLLRHRPVPARQWRRSGQRMNQPRPAASLPSVIREILHPEAISTSAAPRTKIMPDEPRSGLDPCSQVDHTDRAGIFERFASKTTQWSGTTLTFILSVILVVLWLATGPFYDYSDTWQLVLNTVTSIITFLMVFLIQRSQNRDMLGMKIQMSELIASLKEANNLVIDLDRLSERQLEELHRRYQLLSSEQAGKPGDPR